jgi:hypothetical protein
VWSLIGAVCGDRRRSSDELLRKKVQQGGCSNNRRMWQLTAARADDVRFSTLERRGLVPGEMMWPATARCNNARL